MAEAGANQSLPTRAGVPRPQKAGAGAFLAGAIVLFGIGLGGWWMFLRPSAANSANTPQFATARIVLPLESFTVNLADLEEGRFLRVTMSLGVNGELPALVKGENKETESNTVSMATIRDSILTVLAQCKSGDLLTPEGKLKLKADLLEALNRNVPALQAREVYFTEFLVQR
jgi:flagellar FliL protein